MKRFVLCLVMVSLMAGNVFAADAADAAAAVAAAPVGGDELVLKDGSRLKGSIVMLDGGDVIIKTDFAGELKIPAAKIAGVSSAGPVNVHLASGNRHVGQLSYTPAGGQNVTVGNEAKPVDVTKVTRMWPEGADDPELARLRAAAEAEKPKWKLRVEAGLNGETGNSDRINGNGNVLVTRTTPKDRLKLYFLARYGHENGEDTAREFIGGADLEVDIHENLFAYGKVEFETDKFENLDLRSTVTGGLGLFLIREEDTELKVRGGIGFQAESFTNGSNADEVIAEAGVDFRKDISPWLTFTHSTTVQPSLSELGDFRLTMENAGEIPLTNDEKWKLRLGIRNQYDSNPSTGTKSLDTFYFANIGIDF